MRKRQSGLEIVKSLYHIAMTCSNMHNALHAQLVSHSREDTVTGLQDSVQDTIDLWEG